MTSETGLAAERIREAFERSRDVVDLARVASLAVRVEPHLLRRLRLDILSHVDVGIEADLWFSDLVESRGVRHVVLDAAVASVLRTDLARHPELLATAYSVTRSAHANEPPSIVLEEHLNYLSVGAFPDRADRIDQALRPALRTLAAGGPPARDLAQWALRALPRLLPAALETENGIAVTLAASAALGRRKVVSQVPELDVPVERFAWVLRTDADDGVTEIAVELLERGVRFDESGPEYRTIKLPTTTPLLVELSWDAGGTRTTAIVQAEPGRAVDLGAPIDRLTLRTLTGDVYEVAEGERLRPEDAAGPGKGYRGAVLVGFRGSGEHHAAEGTGVRELGSRLEALGYETRPMAVDAGAPEPTPVEVARALEDMMSRSGDDGLIWLHYTGNGLAGEGTRLPLVAMRGEAEDVEWVSLAELAEVGRAGHRGRLLVTVDLTAVVDGTRIEGPLDDTLGSVAVVANGFGGQWEGYGPLSFAVLEALRGEERGTGAGGRVFVSSAAADRDVARRLIDELSAQGVERLWRDDQTLEANDPGSDSSRREAVMSSRCMVVLLSSAGVTSRFVRDEWRAAVDVGVPVIPVLLGDFPGSDMPVELARFQAVSVGEGGLSAAAAEIARGIEGLPAPTPRPGLALRELVERVREGYGRWAKNNDYEPEIVVRMDGDLDLPIAAPDPIEEAAGTGTEPDDGPLADLEGVQRAVARIWTGSQGVPFGMGFLVRGGELSAHLDEDELLLLTVAPPGRASEAEAAVAAQESPSETPGSPAEWVRARLAVQAPAETYGGPVDLDRVVVTLGHSAAPAPESSEGRQYRVGEVVWRSSSESPTILIRLDPPPVQVEGLPLTEDPGADREVHLIGPGAGEGGVGLVTGELIEVDPPWIRYRAEVGPGSAGGPVLNGGWEVIALHWGRGASPSDDDTKMGIGIASIREEVDRDLGLARGASTSGEALDPPRPEVARIFDVVIPRRLKEDADLATSGGSYKFVLTSEKGGRHTWLVDLDDGGRVQPGYDGEATCVITMPTDDFLAMADGSLNPHLAFMTGRMTMRGQVAMVLSVGRLFDLDRRSEGSDLDLRRASGPLNVREGPGVEHPQVAGPLPPGAILQVLGREGEWVRVRAVPPSTSEGGVEGWVLERALMEVDGDLEERER